MTTTNNTPAIKNHNAFIETSTGRKSYAFLLNVNGEPFKIIALGWWCNPSEIAAYKIGMAASARAFKKTAGVLVYELHDDNRYYLCNSCSAAGRNIFPRSFDKDATTVEQIWK